MLISLKIAIEFELHYFFLLGFVEISMIILFENKNRFISSLSIITFF